MGKKKRTVCLVNNERKKVKDETKVKFFARKKRNWIIPVREIQEGCRQGGKEGMARKADT